MLKNWGLTVFNTHGRLFIASDNIRLSVSRQIITPKRAIMATQQIVLSRKQTIEQGAGQQAALALAGLAANQAAAGNVFADYVSRKAKNTVRAQNADLQRFAEFFTAAGVPAPSGQPKPAESDKEGYKGYMVGWADCLQSDPAAWQGVSWGLVEAFVKWMVQQGEAISTLNRRLSTVKVYAKLAAKAGAIEPRELALIKVVSGYSAKEGKRIDENREVTRLSTKKAEAVQITPEQAALLKDQPDTPQGRRDALLMALLLDHGLRAGEVTLLKVGSFDLDAGLLRFYRPKVGKTQTHRLTRGTEQVLQAWIESGDSPAMGELLRGSIKSGELAEQGLSERAITDRVRVLGEQIGLSGLSAHDCRHYWATRAISQGTDPFALQQAGGWTSQATVQRYVEDGKIANERVRL